MRNLFTILAIAALFACLGLAQTPAAQNPDRTFYLSPSSTPADLNVMATLLRTVADTRDISTDPVHGTLTSQGTVDQLMLTDWLVQQLNQPAGGSAVGRNQTSATPEYRMAGANADVVRVFRLAPSATVADLTALVTAIRTVADAQRLFPYEPQKAIAARSSVSRMDAAEWIFHQVYPPAGQTPTAVSPDYPMSDAGRDEVVRVYRLDPGTSNAALTGMVTAIRTVADVQRLFPLESQKALIMRAPAANVAVADWLIQELGKPADAGQPAVKHQYNTPGVTDGVVRVFYLTNHGSTADLTALTTEIRTTADIQRIFPLGDHRAVILRGRADQMSTVEALVAEFDTGAR